MILLAYDDFKTRKSKGEILKRKLLIAVVLITTYYEWHYKISIFNLNGFNFGSHFVGHIFYAFFWFLIAMWCGLSELMEERTNSKKGKSLIVFLIVFLGRRIGVLSYLLFDEKEEQP